LEHELEDPHAWEEFERAEQLSRDLGELKEIVFEVSEVQKRLDNIFLIIGMADRKNEEEKVEDGILEQVGLLEKMLAGKELQLFLSGKYDNRRATLAVYAGAGGDDAEDWAHMLWDMYRSFCGKRGWEFRVIDEHGSQDGGIKSAVAEISGSYAYGYLKGEYGVHRLVRISRFDASKQRHTSFALVEVLPEIAVDEVVIRDEDIDLDLFRSSGPGGQNVNKVESAVRITHKPSGIIVACQSERSQEQNRRKALSLLRAKLHIQAEQSRTKERSGLKGERKEIAWANQIRSYVLHPYKMVKDHRTGTETSQVDKVLAGDLDIFVEAELKVGYTA